MHFVQPSLDSCHRHCLEGQTAVNCLHRSPCGAAPAALYAVSDSCRLLLLPLPPLLLQFMWYATRRVGWRWFVFFSLQGLLLACEGSLKRLCQAAGLALHPVVARLAVLLVLGITADAFFCK